MGFMGSKPLASLSSGLLARKGQAKPAMRPQLLNGGGSLDDLGWNDMGQAPAPVAEVPVRPEAESPVSPPVSPPALPPVLPPVLVERDALAARIAPPEPEPEPASPPTIAPAVAARIGRESAAQTARGKAAFTLRLDADRHLRLRLASAVANRSAQALVVAALDRFLDTMPEVEALAARLPMKDGR